MTEDMTTNETEVPEYDLGTSLFEHKNRVFTAEGLRSGPYRAYLGEAYGETQYLLGESFTVDEVVAGMFDAEESAERFRKWLDAQLESGEVSLVEVDPEVDYTLVVQAVSALWAEVVDLHDTVLEWEDLSEEERLSWVRRIPHLLPSLTADAVNAADAILS